MKSKLDPAALYWGGTSCGRLEVRIRGDFVDAIDQPGDASHAVECALAEPGAVLFPLLPYAEAVARDPSIPECIREELRGYGAWDDAELADEAENLRRFVWLQAGSIGDSDEPDSSEPVLSPPEACRAIGCEATARAMEEFNRDL